MKISIAGIDSHDIQIERAFDLIWNTGFRKIGMMGLSFKPYTDNLRESPLVKLADKLLGLGYQLSIYDPFVYRTLHMKSGAPGYNKDGMPHIFGCLVATPEEVIAFSETLVIGNNTVEFGDMAARCPADMPIIDLVRLIPAIEKRTACKGICR